MQKKLIQILLLPLALLYGGIISLRDMFYETGLMKSSKFNLPVISVGNLSIGGAGKSPHIEYLVRLLKDYIDVGILSRGYKRETSGFRLVTVSDTAKTVGDEPKQFKNKFKDVVVAVDENRAFGIPMMVGQFPGLQAILLDDAFQHRQVEPGLNILLTQYGELFTRDFLLPAGRLREWRSAYKRADIIIVTKCPEELSDIEKDKIRKEINPFDYQKMYFSKFEYDYPYPIYDPRYRIKLDKDIDVILLSAIANTSYLKQYVEGLVKNVFPLEYEDHHHFTKEDIDYIIQKYNSIPSKRKLILTTEKDATRLELFRNAFYEKQIPLFVQPAKVVFLDNGNRDFDEYIKNYLLQFTD
ncbi:MAG: tetraacyldisaccharide 4'-kinase [Saprospiraceae bacterium]|nr:tetraacyldisaccharide 4'-kinase [Saprospiraceae bacterium]